MIRIVCPHCHAPLSSAELEQATVDGHLSLICPECASVLVSDRETAYHALAEHFPEEMLWVLGASASAKPRNHI
ncbi:MAG: hypothetical protein IV101_07910 [Dechloromonas sp.]|nr:hypothetical protein [Dechloromonas sp.]